MEQALVEGPYGIGSLTLSDLNLLPSTKLFHQQQKSVANTYLCTLSSKHNSKNMFGTTSACGSGMRDTSFSFNKHRLKHGNTDFSVATVKH